MDQQPFSPPGTESVNGPLFNWRNGAPFQAADTITPIATLKDSFVKWRKTKPISFQAEVEVTPYGQALFQEYFANGQCAFSIGYQVPRKNPPLRKRGRNTRVQMVQAKRKRLYLSQDGKCCDLRSRKASYAFRLEEERFYEGLRSTSPRLGEYEHKSARRRKVEARRTRRLRSLCFRWDSLGYGQKELAWMYFMEGMHGRTE